MKFWHRNYGRVVEIQQIFESGKALVWSDELADQNHQSTGWEMVKMSKLVPLDYYERHKDKYITDKEKREAKKRLVHVTGTWTATDGKVFTNCEEAVFYERDLERSDEDEVSCR